MKNPSRSRWNSRLPLRATALAAIMLTLSAVPSSGQVPRRSWVTMEDGLANLPDEATAVAVDHMGNIYVTGESGRFEQSTWKSQYLTVKYDASGEMIWADPFAAEDVEGSTGSDIPRAIVVDEDGNVYVTGSSYSGPRSQGRSLNDIITIKYDGDGNRVWQPQRFDRSGYEDVGRDLALDDLGNVYVTGHSDTSDDLSSRDIITIKYNSLGQEEWAIPSGGSDWDEGNAIAIDPSGNIYVVGLGMSQTWDLTISKFTPEGTMPWERFYNDGADERGVDIAIDGAGSVFVAGFVGDTHSSRDYLAMRIIPSNGDVEWATPYDGTGGQDMATSIAVDEAGGVFVTGHSDPHGGFSDTEYATVRFGYDSGNEIWASRYRGLTGQGTSRANAIAVSDAGQVFVTGSSEGGIATLRYDREDGHQVWVAHLENGSGNALAVDHAGLVHVVGESQGDFVTIQYHQSPGLSSELEELSLSMGGTQALSLDAGPEHASKVYVVLGSVSGTTPPAMIENIRVPLTWDDYLIYTVNNWNTELLSNSAGILDADGRATATLNVTAGAYLDLEGQTANHAFVLLEPGSALPIAVSEPVPLLLTQ